MRKKNRLVKPPATTAFADIAALLPKEFSTEAPADAEKTAMAEELKLVKAERDVLAKVLGRKG